MLTGQKILKGNCENIGTCPKGKFVCNQTEVGKNVCGPDYLGKARCQEVGGTKCFAKLPLNFGSCVYGPEASSNQTLETFGVYSRCFEWIETRNNSNQISMPMCHTAKVNISFFPYIFFPYKFFPCKICLPILSVLE